MKPLFSLALIFLLVAGGCASDTGLQTAQLEADFKKIQPEDLTSYKIAPGDVLEITVYGEETLNRTGLVVRPDGKVSFPLVGDLDAGGNASAQVKEQLDQKLREFVPTATTVVSVVQLGSLQYYVVGKVNKPGMYNVSRPINVLQALALAGGLTPFAAESRIIVMRNFGQDSAKLPFNYKEVKKGENIGQNILLKRGDVVLVP